MLALPREDTLIVGAGPIGLACAVSAKRRGIDPLVVDAGAITHSIVRYPVGMTFFTTPDKLEIGGHPLACSGQKPTREEALMYYRGVVRAEGLRVQTFARLVDVQTDGDGLRATLEAARERMQVACQRLVLATGYFDQPNSIGVPGEDLPHVRPHFDEAHLSYGLDAVVIGGKNSAVEAALELFRAGARVTLVYRGLELPPGVKYWLRPDLENRIAAGEIEARFGAEVTAIDERHVAIRRRDGSTEELPADRVYVLIGFLPDFDLFRRIGIELEAGTDRPTVDPTTLETNVPGVYMAGSITAGRATSEIFIENGRFDGEKIFGAA
jgi:thioredoxin reductase (NADPH)